LSPSDVDTWIAYATQFTAGEDKEAIIKRFAWLKMNSDLQARAQDDADKEKWKERWKELVKSDPNSLHYHQRLTDRLGALICASDEARDVARGLVKESRFAGPGNNPFIFTLLEKARKTPEKCPGVRGFTEADWRAVETAKPD
jgi:hypothetical protein